MIHFFEQGNGILCGYDFYPTQFGKISTWSSYLPKLKELGVNALWINPIQLAGDVDGFIKKDKNFGVSAGNVVTRSLYAMKDSNQISPYFSEAPRDENGQLLVGEEEAQNIDQKALQNFTQTAIELGIVPLFDLVLNHVSSDAPLVTKNPHWFLSTDPRFRDAVQFNYEDEKVRNEIIEKLWKPYIYKYFVQYGFLGVRVDAVGLVHPQVRQELYNYIVELSAKMQRPAPIILDEALFSTRPLKDEVDFLKVNGQGPTHIMSQAYLAKTNNKGNLPQWIKEEEAARSTVVFEEKDGKPREHRKGGCVNFSGNHDYHSLAMKVLLEMARERLKTNKHLFSELNADNERVLLYPHVKEIENELSNKNPLTERAVQSRLKQKIAIVALSSSGGWFMLSGDESGDLLAKFVFRRKHALTQDYYAHQVYKPFLDEQQNNFNVALKEMAKVCIFDDVNIRSIYLKSSADEQDKLLVPYIENIKQQINCQDSKACAQFKKRLFETFNQKITFDPSDYELRKRTPENGWLGICNMAPFMSEINKVLHALPASAPGFWSETFKVTSIPHALCVVRSNGDAPSQIDVIVVNLQQTELKLTAIHMQDIANTCKKLVQKQKLYNLNETDLKHLTKTISELKPERLLAVGEVSLETAALNTCEKAIAFRLRSTRIKGKPKESSTKVEAKSNPKNLRKTF